MKISKLLLISMFAAFSASAIAVPSLQLGPGDTGTWEYVAGAEESWFTSDENFSLNAYALDSAWDTANNNQYAYLVVAAAPETELADGDVFGFDIDIVGQSVSMVTSGYGTPPLEDTGGFGVAPHSIYDTYFEIYEFKFDGPLVTVNDQQPGETGSTTGYSESFSVTNIVLDGISGLHFDLFTVNGGDSMDVATFTKDVVNAVAPYSHDAEYIDDCTGVCATTVPEPAMVGLLAFGLLGLAVARRGKNAA